MSDLKIPKRISGAVLNSLNAGVVPRIGLEYIAVGRKAEINSMLNDVSVIEDGGAAFRFVTGKYGSGKSFLLQLIRNYALEKGFVVVDADLSPERRLAGTKGQGLATYKELMQNMSTRTKPDGGALALLLEKWIAGVQAGVAVASGLSPESGDFSTQVQNKITECINEIEGMVHGFDFSKLINLYWLGYKNDDDKKKAAVLRWFRGEFSTRSEAAKELGVNIIISDDNWYDYLKLFADFVVKAGYKGLLVIIDELVNLYKIPNLITRQYNYEKILTIFNDTMQGRARNIYVIMGATPQCINDPRRGIYSYEALRSRLEEGRFSCKNLQDMMGPVIRLEPLTKEELYVLISRLVDMHAVHYNYEPAVSQENIIFFIETEFQRIGSDENITPREIIRDFISLLNILYQNPGLKFESMLSNDNFEFSTGEVNDEVIHKEFAEFEL